MSRMLLPVVSLIISLAPLAAFAQQTNPPKGAAPQPSNPTLQGLRPAPPGALSYWSSVLQSGANDYQIAYVVCNLDQRALIFRWEGPNIVLAPGGRLPGAKCTLNERPVAAFEADRSAKILLTQAGLSQDAPAYVSQLKLPVPIPVDLLPHSLVNRLRTFFGDDPTTTATEVNLYIEQTRSDNVVKHVIAWYPASVTVYISANAFGQPPETVAQRIGTLGYSARVAYVEKDVDPDEAKATLEPGRYANLAIAIDHGASAAPLELSIEGPPTAVGPAYVTAVDHQPVSNGITKNVLIIDSQISAFQGR